MNISIAVTLLWAAVLVEGVLLVLLYRQVGLTYLARGEAIARDGPRIGETLPGRLSVLIGKLPGTNAPWASSVIIFARQNCHVCLALWPELRRFMQTEANNVRVILVFSGSHESAMTYMRTNELEQCGLIEDQTERLFRASRVRISPFAIVVDQHFKVRGKGLVNHQEHLKHLANWRADIQTIPSERVVERGPNAVELAR